MGAWFGVAGAGNRDLKALQDRVQPLFEREEKARKAGLNPVERLKEVGQEGGQEGGAQAGRAGGTVRGGRAAAEETGKGAMVRRSVCVSVLLLLLQEGDELYKGAKFEEAIVKYTQALDRITDKSSELALKAFSNRHVALSLLGQG